MSPGPGGASQPTQPGPFPPRADMGGRLRDRAEVDTAPAASLYPAAPATGRGFP